MRSQRGWTSEEPNILLDSPDEIARHRARLGASWTDPPGELPLGNNVQKVPLSVIPSFGHAACVGTRDSQCGQWRLPSRAVMMLRNLSFVSRASRNRNCSFRERPLDERGRMCREGFGGTIGQALDCTK
jgi:hypothetical protein